MHLLDRSASSERFETFDVGALGDGLPVVLESMLDASANAQIWACAFELSIAPEAKPAGVGREGERDTTVRSDLTRWIEPGDADVALQPLTAMFHALGTHLSRTAYLGLQAFELQLALYREGAYYTRHLDALRGAGTRRVTAIYYPNGHWCPGDGGELVVWTPQAHHIEPAAQRLVVFLSEALEHAVLPVMRAPRLAFTAWYRG